MMDATRPKSASAGGRIMQAFMVSPVVIVLDEGLDLDLKIAVQEVALQQNAVGS